MVESRREGAVEGWIALGRGQQRLDTWERGRRRLDRAGRGHRRLDHACGWPGLDCEMRGVRGGEAE
ncbi:hypothetical protein TIFTF001_007458 [Ficus carica]|uniref:Uncharacterized protein n=1 Tax=Ficus carica TaxID=3494 RepID=A0AA88ADF4_FICCA|nr:hypothetical protein TIFTF001_007458 [Ficus carica]